MNTVMYRLLYGLCYAASLLPLRALYALSDVMSGLLYHIIRYRRKIVRKNLTASFPHKPLKEIAGIEKKYYSWLCDYAVETVKLLSISRSEISRRMKFEAVESLRTSIDDHRSCAVYLGHYCNWEWVTSLPLAVGGEAVCGQIYHPLENHAFDKIFLKLRSRFGARNMAMNEAFRHILEATEKGETTVTGFIADQVPMWNSIHYWTNFLNHDTPVFTGAERIARKCHFDVFYLDMKRVRRGYYTARFVPITRQIDECGEYAVTERYMRMLEQSISDAPQYWLWSHNRWKRTREKWEQRNA